MSDEVRARLQEASEREEFNSGGDVLALLGDDIRAVLAEVERLREALEGIAKGEGRYNRDPLTHASNTIEDMQALAIAALRGEGEK